LSYVGGMVMYVGGVMVIGEMLSGGEEEGDGVVIE